MKKNKYQSFNHELISFYFYKFHDFSSSNYFIYFIFLFLSLSSVFLIVFNFTKYAILSIFTLVGLYLYILVNKLTICPFYISKREWVYLFIIIFMLISSLSIIYLQIFAPIYTKPFFYYVLIGICSSSLFLISRSRFVYEIRPLMPFLLALFSLNVFLSNYIVFPQGIYSSGDTHANIYTYVWPIVKTGHIPQGYTYSFFPLHQIYVASTSIISNLDPKYLYLYLPSLVYTIIGLFLYTFSRRVFNNLDIETMCFLFYSISPEVVYHAVHVFQFSYAAPVSIMLLLLGILLYFPRDNHMIRNIKLQYQILFIILIFTLVWMHQFTSTLTLLLLIILFSVSCVVFKDADILSYMTIFLLYVTILFGHWIYASKTFDSLINVFFSYYTSLFSPENYQASIMLSESGIISDPPFWVTFSNALGIGLMLALGLIGSLYGIRKNNINLFLMFILGGFIWGIISIGSFIKMSLLFSSRILVFFWTLSISFIASVGILFISEKLGKIGLVICCFLFFIISIFNLGSPLSGSETSFLLGNQPSIKLYDTKEDIDAYLWITTKVPEDSYIELNEHWILQSYDPLRFYRELNFDGQNDINISQLQSGEYILLSKYSSKGLRIRGTTTETSQLKSISSDKTAIETYISYSKLIKIDFFKLRRAVSKLNCIYSNGGICINYK